MSRHQAFARHAVAQHDRKRAIEASSEPTVMVAVGGCDLFKTILDNFRDDVAYHLCSDPSQALEEHRRFKPAVVILDIRSATTTAHPLALVPPLSRAGTKVVLLGTSVSGKIRSLSVSAGAWDIVDDAYRPWIDELIASVNVGLGARPSVAPDSADAIVGSTVH